MTSVGKSVLKWALVHTSEMVSWYVPSSWKETWKHVIRVFNLDFISTSILT